MATTTLLFSEKRVYEDGAILQAKLWVLPASKRVPGSAHSLKYSLYYGRPGQRIVAYDNESRKGDHVHRGDVETPYRFVSVEQLMLDFLAEVRSLRGGSM
ncbi:toxin-antitoxin system TumE family protein [Methylobacterium tarhaniae]|uniref:toxin-antitoxin system TumE family protein n=1 Tax=Methylobacterium tarhaniae TaxID=1187852 RepID=UPI003CFE841D